MKKVNMDNDELIIKNAINSVNTPEYNIVSEIEKSRATKKSPSFKRHLVTATASILLMLFTVGAAAATISGFKYLLSIIGEENATVITPVEISDEDRGIKMEVVAAGRFDNMLKVYVTLQDMIGERLGDDVSLFKYSKLTGIERAGGMKGGWELIDYDGEKNKATMLFELAGSSKLEGEELTLKINKILYNTKEYWNYKVTEANLPKVDRNPPIFYARMNQFLSTSNINYIGEDVVPVLKEQSDIINFPQAEEFNICAMGVVDGKLHIKTRNYENADKDISYNLYFVDLKSPQKYENLINPEGIFRFDLDEKGNITRETDFPAYIENIYDIDTDRLGEYELLAYIVESDAIEGDWEVSFNSKDSGKILKTECNLDMDDVTVEYAAINPFGGIRIEGTIDDHVKIPVMFDVKINMSDGEIIPSSISTYEYSGDRTGNSDAKTVNKFEAFYETGKLVDLNSVVSLEINGKIVDIKR